MDGDALVKEVLAYKNFPIKSGITKVPVRLKVVHWFYRAPIFVGIQFNEIRIEQMFIDIAPDKTPFFNRMTDILFLHVNIYVVVLIIFLFSFSVLRM